MDKRITAGLLLDTMAEGVLVLDPNGSIRIWNHSMTVMTGYARDEAIGRPVSWLKAPGCGGVPHLAAALSDATAGPCVNGCECRLLNRAGDEIPVLINARMLAARDGAPLGLLLTISDFRPVARLQKEVQALESKLKSDDDFHGLIGHSEQMLAVQRLIRLAAESESTVLILGASGTGKELVASAIHALGPRAGHPLVKVNCGALTENLLESELFGHVKGAFTGAYRDRKGRFESADHGTLFLDEVGEISPAMQIKLLRVLQEGEFEPVGSEKTRRVNVRVIAATNRDLQEAMRAGRFREDLYYRLRVFPISIPPLSERREDIPALVRFLINRHAARTGKLITGIRPDALKQIMAYPWPGNVRELENAVEYAFIVCQENSITPQDLPEEVRNPPAGHPTGSAPASLPRLRGQMPGPTQLRQLLTDCGWNKAEAARRLGISRTAVWKWMRKSGIPLQDSARESQTSSDNAGNASSRAD